MTVTAIVYSVGDTGPGGGTIFYVATTPFACGPTLASSCTYLEAAPSGWNTGTDPILTWANTDNEGTAVGSSGSPETATATGIGWGYRNTRAIILQGNADTATSAAALADSHTVTVSGVVYDDWYLPSSEELDQLYLERDTVGGFVDEYYWSSSEWNLFGSIARIQDFDDGDKNFNLKKFDNYVRPVRAF